MIVEVPLDENAAHFFSFLRRPFGGQAAHHFGHFLSAEHQLNFLSVPAAGDRQKECKHEIVLGQHEITMKWEREKQELRQDEKN